MNGDAFSSLVTFLNQLEQKLISYTLVYNREEAIMVLVATPGERWEIGFLPNGGIEVEKFISTGEIRGAESLGEFFARYEDPDATATLPKETVVAPRVGKVV
jgi:hypothetical protein